MDAELPWFEIRAYVVPLEPGDDPDEPAVRIRMSDNLRADDQVRLARQVAQMADLWRADVERWASEQAS